MIIFQDVCKVFDSREVLRRIDWRIRTGERWLVSGVSGIGKTTLLRLLMGLDTPDSGMVTGTDGLRFAPVFQEDRLVEHWSAMANVSLVCTDGARVRTMLTALLPTDSLDQPVHTLSGGMRRRVALARALAAESDVLVLDGLNKLMTKNGANAVLANNATGWPKLHPGANVLSAPDALTVEYYPVFL